MASHLEKTKTLIILTSEKSDKDFETFKEFVTGLTRRSSHQIDIIRAPERGVDFENYEETAAGLRAAVDHAVKNCGSKLKDVTIDATAGQKIFSVAASIVTINNQISLTYVNNQGRVRSYDASIQLGDIS